MTTILKPDDVLKVGDIIHYYSDDHTCAIGGYGAGFMRKVWLTGREDVAYVERPDSDSPDPVMSDADKVKVLREALELVTKDTYQRQMLSVITVEKIDAALDATK
jgi:hypothetical protein